MSNDLRNPLATIGMASKLLATNPDARDKYLATIDRSLDRATHLLLQTIFEPMKRGTTKGSASRSVGLGLFIVQQIAKAHGGIATVASTADATTFSVEVPRVASPRSRDDSQ